MPERPWWKRSNCISKSGSRTRRASRAGLRRIRGKTAAAEKGDKAHCPTPSMGNALCPLSVAPRTLSVAPADSAHAHHTPSVWLVSRKKHAGVPLSGPNTVRNKASLMALQTRCSRSSAVMLLYAVSPLYSLHPRPLPAASVRKNARTSNHSGCCSSAARTLPENSEF